MYRIKKAFRVEGAHRLELDYDSPCNYLHGHSWLITVYCQSEELDKNGMVIDFSKISRQIKDKLDHKSLNDVLDFNSTAEIIAFWAYSQIDSCYQVDIQETEGNVATYKET